MSNRKQEPTAARPSRGKQSAERRARGKRLRAQLLVGGVGVLVLALVGTLAFRGSDSGDAVLTPTAFSLPELNGGGTVALADFAGRPTVVNFFASWCSACDDELPGFREEALALKDQVAFIGVDSLETGDKNLMPRRHKLEGSFAALAQDVGGANRSGLHDALGGGNSMPLTAFYDARGELLSVERTALSRSALRQKMVELFDLPA